MRAALPPKLDSLDDLFAIIRTMPDQDRFRALGIFNRMKTRRISISIAMEEFKELFFKNGIFEPGEDGTTHEHG